MFNPDRYKLAEILTSSKTIAAVGASDKLTNGSVHVLPFLISKGFTIYPVNPNEKEIAGLKAYASIDDIPEKIDILSIFRAAKYAADLVKDAIRLKIPVVWLQEGISADAMQLAEEGGVVFVSNVCIANTYQYLNL